MREWLGYLASDELQGRQTFTEGYGLAASYVAGLLKQWGVKPLGDGGTYFEGVRIRGYKVTRNSSVTVTANGASRTFKHGDHVTFPVGPGGKQTLTFTGAEFIGYGQARRPAESRREGQARNLDAEPRACACAQEGEAGAVVPRLRSTRTARPRQSALLRCRTRPRPNARLPKRGKRCRRQPTPFSRRRRNCKVAVLPARADVERSPHRISRALSALMRPRFRRSSAMRRSSKRCSREHRAALPSCGRKPRKASRSPRRRFP